MAKFLIATVSKLSNGMTYVGEMSTVNEVLFYQTLNDKIKEIVETEDQFLVCKEEILNHLKTKSLIVKDLHFEIKSK